jgi:phosphoribosyl-dephospho-CoA transferase
MAEPALRRHDLAWLAPGAAALARPDGPCGAGNREAVLRLADWVAAGHPLIVARQNPAGAADTVRLGLALPPALGKGRFAFRVPRAAIARSTRPPRLDAAVAAHLPDAWRARILTLAAVPEIVHASPRLIGSTAMQAVTGLDCVSAGSDLDLLLEPRDWPAAQAACGALERLDDPLIAPRLDGEVCTPAGAAVAWCELVTTSRQVLVKTRDAVSLIDRQSFAAAFAADEEVAT